MSIERGAYLFVWSAENFNFFNTRFGDEEGDDDDKLCLYLIKCKI